MFEKDRPVAASEKLVSAAAKKDLPAARATISASDQETGAALFRCRRERFGCPASTRRHDLHLGLDPSNLSRARSHFGGDTTIVFGDTHK